MCLGSPCNNGAGPWIPAFAGMTGDGVWLAHVLRCTPQTCHFAPRIKRDRLDAEFTATQMNS